MALVQSSRSPEEQLKLLHQEGNRCHFPNFDMKVKEMNALPLIAGAVEILQINLGKMCNQTCHHCHVDAGPHRKEIMSKEVLEQCLKILSKNEIATVDLTGGAPEMNPHFRWFVEEASELGVKVMVRCNLTIILAHEKYRELPEFYRDHNVEVISSLPHYTKLRTDRQRGHGVFERSIEALQMLNTVGYGKQRTDLKLNLVYNPGGAFFPGDQAGLEREFKRKLLADFGIEFNHLYCIT
ncbi:MAG: radical SAM protein, partial [Bdellovibrionales bacterium]|nr:radical SAM protein [Bdellovibrionales bacterium]